MIVDDIQKVGRVLILGYGREGKSVHAFLTANYPKVQVEIADQKDGPDYLKKIDSHQIIIKSPGINPHLPEIIAARAAGKAFTSETQLFFELCPGKIIGVTGTKGKSTTSSLIHHILTRSGLESVLVGNIGDPSLDALSRITANTWVVFELSSHQLMDVTRSPHIAVLLNIMPEHLDYYTDFAEYVQAKHNLVRHQAAHDFFVYNPEHPTSKAAAELTPAQKRPFTMQQVEQDIFSIIPAKEIPLKGTFNLENILAAIRVGKILGLDAQQLHWGISTFTPLSHRLEKVGNTTFNGITFYDDTLATLPEATIAALEALSDTDTIIVGGSDRKQDFTKLGKVIAHSQIHNVILFPVTGERIWRCIEEANPGRDITSFSTDSMEEAVKIAYAQTQPGKICLLSSASPSFTTFKDYRDKSAQFEKYIRQYAI